MRALTALAFEELHDFPGAIREMHLGIAERAFRGVGPASLPVRVVHDAVARAVYASLGVGASQAARVSDTALAQGGVGEDLALSGTPSGSAVIAALNGLIGDRLEDSGSALHQSVSVRLDGEVVGLDPSSLAYAFPDATERIVVFLHGLMGTEFYWQWGAADRGGSYGARLARELGYSPLYLRYNSGRHISQNGRSVAELLEELARSWPVEVGEVVLIGHSMGGLVARSACHYGSQSDQRWTQHVTHVVSLGTPHLGAPLEQAAHYAAAALSVLPETRMLGSFLRRRSAGIRDLRHGSLVDEDWRGRDPDALRAAACKEVPLLEGATHCFVSATITRSPRHPLGRLLGDTLVLVPSASGKGRTRRIPFEDDNGHNVGSTHHLALMIHPEVYARLRGWLVQPRSRGIRRR
ncbi:MAG TPA: alpha/beta hydrolase [Solirubrobacteraceae bacterium]|nr:alpha/beta hydrolase [Solirubrobacteraceae bacterium]